MELVVEEGLLPHQSSPVQLAGMANTPLASQEPWYEQLL